MTDSERTKLRALAEAATSDKTTVEYELPDGSWTTDYDLAKGAHPPLTRFGYRTWTTLGRFQEAANPTTVLALLDELDRLRTDRDSYANSDFERQLAEARAEIERLNTLGRCDDLLRQCNNDQFRKLEVQLAAMTAARDDACDIADWYVRGVSHSKESRISELRSVGKEPK